MTHGGSTCTPSVSFSARFSFNGGLCVGNCVTAPAQLPPRQLTGNHLLQRSMDDVKVVENVQSLRADVVQDTLYPSAIPATCDGVISVSGLGVGTVTGSSGESVTGEDSVRTVSMSNRVPASRLRQNSTASSDNESTYSGNSSTSSGSTKSSYGLTRSHSKGMSCTSPRAIPVWGLSRLRLQSGSRDQEGLATSQFGASTAETNGGAPVLKRKRPPKLVIPTQELSSGPFSAKMETDEDSVSEVTVEGSYYGVYCKRGRREVLEDAYEAIPELNGDPGQAFFGVYDGHGGRKAADFAAKHLARNIVKAMTEAGDQEDALEGAVRDGYLHTDRDFLGQEEDLVSGGASCVTSVMKGGKLYVANAGDCRAVLSRSGVAEALTRDHRASREDEKRRIEKLGGLVVDCSGVWRVQNTLAVSRGIGDLNLKEFITAEPEVRTVPITSDCDFLILASDGLWDMVSNQEAVSTARAVLDGSQSATSPLAGRNGDGTVCLAESQSARSGSRGSPRSQGGNTMRWQTQSASTSRQSGLKLSGTPRRYHRSKTWSEGSGGAGTQRGGGGAGGSGGEGSVGNAVASHSFPCASPKGGFIPSPRVIGRGSKRSCEDGWDTESRNSTEAQGDEEESGEEVDCTDSRKEGGSMQGRAGSPPSLPKLGPVAACRKLVELSVTRGTPDDVSVLIISLDKFHQVVGKASTQGLGYDRTALPPQLRRMGSITRSSPRLTIERAESDQGPSRDVERAEFFAPPKKRPSPSLDFDMDVSLPSTSLPSTSGP